MKQVWILNHYGQEPVGTGGTRHYHLAKYLKAFGWNATIIAASVEHQTGRQRLRPDEHARLERHEGVSFLWVRTSGYCGNGGGRMGNMLQYAARVLQRRTVSGLEAPDVVIGSSVHPFAAWSGAMLARRFDVPFIFEVRDFWPQTLIDMGRLKEGGLTTWAFRKLEKWLYLRADRIVCLLPNGADYIGLCGVSKEKVVWLPNGVDLSDFPAPCGKPSGDVFTLMYFGAHGRANALETVVKAMAIVKTAGLGGKVRLRMVGGGPEKGALEDLAAELGLGSDTVSFEESVPKRAIPALAAQADAFVIAVRDLPRLYRYGISMNKMFDYLAAGRPILMSSGAVNNPIADAGCGLTVSPENPEALARAIERIVATPVEEREAMGRSARAYVEQKHDYRELARLLAATLNSCLADQ